jgi:hypothetical protein
MSNDPSNNSPRALGNILGMAQLAAILLQAAGLVWLGGRWSAEMTSTAERVRDLQSIVSDLTKSQAQAAIIDATQSARMETIYKRIDEIVTKLERFDASVSRKQS